MKSPVITEIVGNDLCIGCGLCVAFCPKEALDIAWNQHGEYNPVEAIPCITECSLCLKVCPFADNEENEDTIGRDLYSSVPGIQHLSETGFYLAAYIGYSERHRPASASGGVATWLMERLLAEGVVDYVICVALTGNPERLFTFTISNTPEAVRAGAGSAYYPVEMSEVIKQVLEVPGRYAVTGLPCFIKAIRLAQRNNAKLKERVVVAIGLVCGQLKSKHFTDYIAAFAGVREKVTGVRYRGKSPDQPASNFHFAFKTENGNGEERRIFWREGISEAWTNRWFTPNACNYCDDVFAEGADATCMDAWLPEYLQDSRGTSLVLVRSPLIREMIARGHGVCLDPIPVERVVQSQSGVVAIKRRYLAYRLYFDQVNGTRVVQKRVAPLRPENLFLQQEVILKEKMRIVSKDLWTVDIQDPYSLREAMRPAQRQLAFVRRFGKVISLPITILRYTWDKVRSIHYE